MVAVRIWQLEDVLEYIARRDLEGQSEWHRGQILLVLRDLAELPTLDEPLAGKPSYITEEASDKVRNYLRHER